MNKAEDPWFRLHSRKTVAAMVSGPANAMETLIYTTLIKFVSLFIKCKKTTEICIVKSIFPFVIVYGSLLIK